MKIPTFSEINKATGGSQPFSFKPPSGKRPTLSDIVSRGVAGNESRMTPLMTPDATRGASDRGMVTQSAVQPVARPQPAPLAVSQTAPQPTPAPQSAPTPTQAPQIAPTTQPQPQVDPRRQALEAFQASLQPTDAERATQEEIARLQEGTALGDLKIREQAIPQDLLIGQRRLLADQSMVPLQTLEARLARQQAERQLQSQSARAGLEFEQASLPKPQEGFTLGEGQARFDAQGNLIAGNIPQSQPKIPIISPTGQMVSFNNLSPEQQAQLSGATRAVMQNPQGFSGLTPTVQGQVLEELGTMGIDASPLFPDASRANAARAAFTVVRDGKTALEFMDSDPSFFGSDGRAKSGTLAAISRRVQASIPGTNEYEIQRLIQSMRDNIGIDALLNIKREGSGLGAVPQRQLETLQGLLGRIEITRDPALLKRDIQDVLTMYQDVLDTSGEDVMRVMNPGGSDDAVFKFIEQNPNATDQEVLQFMQGRQSFNSVGGDTKQASGNLPQRNNNPGNVKAGGLADQFAIGTDNQGHLIFPTPEAGFQALQADLQAKLSGRSRFVKANPTIAELGKVYAEDPNWANSVARILGVDKNTRTGTIDFNKLTQAIARQEGFYA